MLSHGDAATSGYMTRVHVQKGRGGRGEGVPGYTGNTEVHQNQRDVIISDQIQLRHMELNCPSYFFSETWYKLNNRLKY
jgi:hypothetical protein